MPEAELSEFKKDQIYTLFRLLNITRASLVVGDDDQYEFVDLSQRLDSSFELWKPGDIPVPKRLESASQICPCCGATVEVTAVDEDIKEFITEDYHCHNCNFNGTQWSQKVFIGHTSGVSDYTVDTYKKYLKSLT